MKKMLLIFAIFMMGNLLANDFILVKVDKETDLSEVKAALYEKYGLNLVSFIESTYEFVLKCDDDCDQLSKKSDYIDKFETRVVTEKEYQEIAARPKNK